MRRFALVLAALSAWAVLTAPEAVATTAAWLTATSLPRHDRVRPVRG